MSLDIATVRGLLQQFKLKELFNELGWDRLSGRPIPLEVKGVVFAFTPIAEKRGLQVFECRSTDVPDHPTRMKLERELARQAYEHLVVFSDEHQTQQVWQWVRRETGKPLALRTTRYDKGTSGDLLLQKLQALVISFEEEESLNLTDVTRRTKKAFDVERVTKKFYEQFQKEHQAFFYLVSGLPDDARPWYTSLMLNRLMFVYFVQKKKFLDGNDNYLRDRLEKVQKLKGKGKFHSFYRDFLLVLFHDALGSQQRPTDPEMLELLGNIPYLNGGLFEIHPLEAENAGIQIPDEAFERVLTFFEQFQWHLDDRPLREGNEINPDVLGYIFEKYINQKQMGAYYTKEDITEYISKNTILPHLLETTRQGCKVAFEGEGSLWKLLSQDPDRYIYEAVRRGAKVPESQLPDFVQKGMRDPEARMFERRYNLGEASLQDAEGKPLTLPTETWREYISRRGRYHELKEKLKSGGVQSVSDLITLNLDIRQFAQDVLDSAEGADLVGAYWKALTEIKILDPTCGSGAFLFAALNILQPLYESALDKMEALVSEADAGGSSQKYANFRKTLTEVAKHPSERYYVLKSIVVNNLYGVDIMEEATEIAKLRLFLKLMSQVERPDQIEPLPDVDFNIRAGNALVGFATEDELDRALSAQLDLFNTKDALKEKLDDVEALFGQFRLQQTTHGGAVTPADKKALRDRLKTLEEELNRHLAAQYGIDPKKPKDYTQWKESHKPFHWFVDFYGIIKNGGFDAIIGNPPYVEYSKVRNEYTILEDRFLTYRSANLYPFCIERSYAIQKSDSYIGMIIPISAFANQSMSTLQALLKQSGPIFISTFHQRPAQLFDGVLQRLSIFISRKSSSDGDRVFTSEVNRWYSDARVELFQKLAFQQVNQSGQSHILKVGNTIEKSIISKFYSQHPISNYLIQSKNFDGNSLSYRTAGGGYWWTFLVGEFETDSLSNKKAHFSESYDSRVFMAIANSSLFWWYYFTNYDLFNLKDYMIFGFRFGYPTDQIERSLIDLAVKLEQDLMAKSLSLNLLVG